MSLPKQLITSDAFHRCDLMQPFSHCSCLKCATGKFTSFDLFSLFYQAVLHVALEGFKHLLLLSSLFVNDCLGLSETAVFY